MSSYQELVLRDRYKTIAQIGQGGMSVVHFAQDLNIGSYWAIKQVKNNSSVEFDAFLKEVELLASLSHSDIPRIVDRIEIGDDYFVVMDFISGTSLSKIVNIEGPQQEEKVIQWGVKICSIMEYLHSSDPAIEKNPIVYRDLKPDNVMLTPAGEIKLIDFGIAREYTPGKRLAGESLGTRGYAAPEQYKGASNILGESSDIYTLGATLYYLSTGFTPDVPPNGIPSVRSKNTNLSDSFEYVVAKCTADNPENRYQSFSEVKADLENIKHLSAIYRKKMKRRLVLFWTSLIMSFVFAFIGWRGYINVQVELQDRFQAAYQKATSYEREKDYINASKYYVEALKAKPADRETHILLYNSLLPHDNEENHREKTMSAIDEIHKSYLDNKESPMYRDPQLAYISARKCIEIEDVQYSTMALNYIDLIKDSSVYKDGDLSARELNALEVIAAFQTQDSATADFETFFQTLADLEEYTDSSDLTPDESLDNYYMLIRMYSTYPTGIEGAYEKVYEIGNKARAVLIENKDNENMTFPNMIPMYKLVATVQSNRAALNADEKQKEQAYLKSIEWFEYLDDLKVKLDESLMLKKANAYKGVFDAYNTPNRIGEIDNKIHTYISQAINQYEDIISKNPECFVAYLHLTQAYFDEQMLLSQPERNFEKALNTYQVAAYIANTNETISNMQRMQFATLTNLLQNSGLEVSR